MIIIDDRRVEGLAKATTDPGDYHRVGRAGQDNLDAFGGFVIRVAERLDRNRRLGLTRREHHRPGLSSEILTRRRRPGRLNRIEDRHGLRRRREQFDPERVDRNPTVTLRQERRLTIVNPHNSRTRRLIIIDDRRVEGLAKATTDPGDYHRVGRAGQDNLDAFGGFVIRVAERLDRNRRLGLTRREHHRPGLSSEILTRRRRPGRLNRIEDRHGLRRRREQFDPERVDRNPTVTLRQERRLTIVNPHNSDCVGLGAYKNRYRQCRRTAINIGNGGCKNIGHICGGSFWPSGGMAGRRGGGVSEGAVGVDDDGALGRGGRAAVGQNIAVGVGGA